MFQQNQRPFRENLSMRSSPGLAVALSLAGLFALLPGCSAARPDPAQAFDEITRRSLNEDVQYVRARLAPSFIAAARAQHANVDSDEYVRSLMAQLQLCRSTSVLKTDDPDRVTVETACVQSGSIQQSKFDLIYDKKSGWMLSAPAYDTRPLPKAKPNP